MYPKMKRKVSKTGGFRLSPNEEALLLKEEHERRRKLRLQQVREQERNIALQIRQDVKQRRDEQLHQLAEELKAEWQKAQDEKIKALEKFYLSSLRAVGEGHRQAKENEPDLVALAKQTEERKLRAERRHKEALKQQKNQKEKLLREQTWRANVRKHALDIEKERAVKIASLPPPPPHPYENIEMKSVPTVKVHDVDRFSITRHHLFDPHVDREMDTEQPDARLLAEEEVKRQEGLQKEDEREKREWLEKAQLRGKHALKMVRLARDREKLMQELEQMQSMDLARRRQIVAQMPPQLFEPAYRRMEIKEEWQRELECAFEDMYTGDRKMKGDLILHLEPQPLPTFSDQSQDDELEVSQEPDSVCEVPPKLGDEGKNNEPNGREVAPQTQSKPALKKLLNKIRNQKKHLSAHEPETPSEIETIESGTISSRERRLCESEPEHELNGDPVSETKDLPEILDQTVVAGNVVLRHPQEQATEIREEAKTQDQMEWLEHQKQQQLALLQQIEEQKIRLEVDFLKSQMQCQEEEIKRDQERRVQQSQTGQMNGVGSVVYQQQEVEHKSESAIGLQEPNTSREDDHIQMIRDYQQRLLLQNRMHKESVEEARRRLLEYQNKLKQRYSSAAATSLLVPAERPPHQSSIPEPPPQLQGVDVLQKVNRTSYQSSKNAAVQDFSQPADHSELPWALEKPLKEESKGQTFDMGSGRRVQHTHSLEDQTPVQLTQSSCSHQQIEKLGAVKMPATQPLEFHGIPGSLMFRSQESSVITQPVTRTEQVRSILPGDSSSQPSEMCQSDKAVPHVPPTESILLTTSFKHQYVPTESRMRTTLEPTYLPPFQPLCSLPSPVDSEAERTQESLVIKNRSLSSSNIVELRNRMLASSESIQAQQEHLKALQEQLDEQREALLSRQKVQEELLMKKHSQLKQQMEQQQEALKDFLKRAAQSSTCRMMTQAQETDSSNVLTALSEEAKDSNQEGAHFGDTSSHVETNVSAQSIDSADLIESFESICGREKTWKPSKPPVAKVKFGLDLEQHELSVIPELDTPRSAILSTTGHRESLPGDTFLGSNVSELQTSKCPNESSSEETDILRITAGTKEQSSSQSLINQDQLSGSWCEKLVIEAGGLHDPVYPREPTYTDQGLPSTADDIGRRVATYSESSLRPSDTVGLPATWSPVSLSPLLYAQEAASSNLSSFTISTDSFITNENPDRSLTSTGVCSAREHLGHISSTLEEKANSWGPSISVLYKQDHPSEAHNPCLFSAETLLSDRSKIQQLIDKYTRDLSWSSLSNRSSHDLAVGFDVTDTEQKLPYSHHELLQPVEPNPDLDTFSPLSQSSIFHGSKNLSKESDLSKSPELTASSLEGRRYSLSLLNIGRLGSTLQTEQAGVETEEPTEGAEELFQYLPVEFTLSELGKSADEPGDLSPVFEQNLEARKSVESNMFVPPENVQRRVLERDEANIDPHSPVENFRSPSLSPIEEQGSFYQLLPDYGTVKNALEMVYSEDMASREENQCFVELPVVSADQTCEMATENVVMNDDLESAFSQCTLHAVGEQSSVLSLPEEMNCKVLIHSVQNSLQQSGCMSDNTLQQTNSNSTQAKSSDCCVPQSKIPVWETPTGQGIMEEPELTLISSSDISTVESDLELLSQPDSGKVKTENVLCSDSSDVKSCPKSRGLFPLNSEVGDTISTQPANYPLIAESPKEDCGQKCEPTAVLPEFTAVPGSLQEAFLKQKKDFIERSSKRLKKLKSREQSSEKPPAKASKQKKTQLHKPKENLLPAGVAVDHLKGIEEVKICCTSDRKTAEAQMYQRTSRLYNNLSEVKIRKEERDRQEVYARNRERARAFQKRTLEKLRSKKR